MKSRKIGSIFAIAAFSTIVLSIVAAYFVGGVEDSKLRQKLILDTAVIATTVEPEAIY
jgi:hypothetical protein